MTFRVVCIDARPTSTLRIPVPLKKGKIYTVTGQDSEPDEFGGLAYFLAEVEGIFYHWRFRPVVERKTDISIFTRMLTDQKVNA